MAALDRRIVLAAAAAVLLVAPAGAGGTSEGTGQVVEGHTTYERLTVEPSPTVSVIGDVRCHVEVLDVTVNVPPRVGGFDAECDADVTVFGSSLGAPDPRDHVLAPTGSAYEAVGPRGDVWTTTEHVYEAGGSTWKAWTVDSGERRVDPGSGDAYRFVAALPGDEVRGEELRLRAGSVVG